jgi:uncharacterized protein YbaR (Trm112 family)
MTLDPALLEILACPEDKGPLYYLPESITVDDAEHQRIMSVVDAAGITPTFDPDSSER